MPKQRGRGGKKGRKGKKALGKRELIFKEDQQEYGQVEKLLGNGTATISCFDGKTRLGVICGKMKNRVWIKVHDIVLVSLREFEDGGKKCDIIHKYFPDEAKELKAQNEIPENTLIEDRPENEDGKDDINLKFDSDGDDEEYEEEEEDDNDLPPGSSDEEYWEKERAKDIRKMEEKKARKNQQEDEDEEEEMEDKDTKPEKVAPAKGKDEKGKDDKGKKEEPKKPVAPAKPEDKKSKVDTKKADQKRKQDGKKKRGGDSDSEDSGDKLADI